MFNTSFDATPFFQQATDKQIVDLAACDWRGDYPADAVAWHVSELPGYEEVVRVLDYPTRLKNMGFECSVEPKDALAWLATHRPQTLALVKAAVLEATGEWEDPKHTVEQEQAKPQAIYIVEISDVLTIKRTARLIVVAPHYTAVDVAVTMVETAAIDRAIGPCDITWTEQQTNAEPYEAMLDQNPEAFRFVELLEMRRLPGGLDPDDTAEFDKLAEHLGIEDAEILRFGEKFLRGSIPPGR